MPILTPPPPAPEQPGLNDRLIVQTADFGPPPQPRDQAYFRRVIDRNLPAAYIDGLNQGGGSEILEGLAATAARVSLMESRWDAATLAGYASLGQRATGWVYFFRDTAAAGFVTVKKGTIVATSDRRSFYTKADAVFDTSDLGPVAVPIEATLPGYEYNVGGERLTELGETVPGEINDIALLLEFPEFGDPSMRVRNVAPTEGGADPQLEQVAADRGVSPKHADETVDSFRLRVKTVTDGVSPAGIERSGRNLFRRWSPYFQFSILDAWDPGYQTAYDCLIPGYPNFPPTTFVYDDPRPPSAVNRWLSHEDANGGGFVAAMSKLPCLQDAAIWLDDPAAIPSDWLTPGTDGGRRAASYTDLPDVVPEEVLRCGVDGRDSAADGTYASAYKSLMDLKPAGTSFHMILLGEP